MHAALSVALFVEGGAQLRPVRGTADPLTRIWNEHLLGLADRRQFDFIFPISKTHLVAMDPANPPMSGNAEALDQLMARLQGSGRTFDAAVVAWDLQPRWDARAACCRWAETLDLYRCLARSEHLDGRWTDSARARLAELEERSTPGARQSAARLHPGMVLPICMDPMFESVLTASESDLRRALGVDGVRVPDWPTRWNRAGVQPDSDLLGPAVRAARRVNPQLRRTIPGPLETDKDAWGELLLRRLISDPGARTRLEADPIVERLREVAPR